jgi:hypothetical protein
MQMKTSTWIKSIMFYMVIGLFVLTHSAIADDSVAADAFLKSKLDQVFKVLQKTDVEQPEKSKEIVEIIFGPAILARLKQRKKGKIYGAFCGPPQAVIP